SKFSMPGPPRTKFQSIPNYLLIKPTIGSPSPTTVSDFIKSTQGRSLTSFSVSMSNRPMKEQVSDWLSARKLPRTTTELLSLNRSQEWAQRSTSTFPTTTLNFDLTRSTTKKGASGPLRMITSLNQCCDGVWSPVFETC